MQERNKPSVNPQQSQPSNSNVQENQVSNLKSSDFLTSEDLLDNKKDNSVPKNMAPPILNPSMMDFPDLHGSDNIVPNTVTKKKIEKEITPEKIDLGKETLLEDAIQRDIDSIRSKNVNVKQDPKDILKYIIAMGEYKETFEVYGAKWTFRALDQNDLLMALDEVKDNLESYAGRMSANMFAHVVFSLEAINNIPIYQWFPEIKLESFGGNKQEYILACKIALKQYLGAMPPNVIDALYEKYLEVDEKRNKALVDLKNS